MKNRLSTQSSPYLRQHAENPVDWYPWCREAFEKARSEDKPVFLSIGYSTCHWCHVMARESFESPEVADILNRHFVSIKVDREERPDVDSVYMAVCQAFTGSGGWPTSIFMTPEQKPFFAGTYFPRESRYGMPGFIELLELIRKKWADSREELLRSADELISMLNEPQHGGGDIDETLPSRAAESFRSSFDSRFGGFGSAPKFPSPHNLMFLLEYYRRNGDEAALAMAETTLLQMYRGGLFDHIGGGFCRYSTDRYFLAPHFEKMLYDQALLIMAYGTAAHVTGNGLYADIAERTAQYLLREMRADSGAFYCAQDADSGGEEGKYYLFTPDEIAGVIGDAAEDFCRCYDITSDGNFGGKSIPNLLHGASLGKEFEKYLPRIYEYRRRRCALHTDDKTLTAWNALAACAFTVLYRVCGKEEYLSAARRIAELIETDMSAEGELSVSIGGGSPGFLDDYALFILALTELYETALEPRCLELAHSLTLRVLHDFADRTGGFYMYGAGHERLISRPKEIFDGAMPCGNSVMAYVLVKLYHITHDEKLRVEAEKQLAFMSHAAQAYPAGHAFFVTALQAYISPPPSLVIVPKDMSELAALPPDISLDYTVARAGSAGEYKLLNDRTTYYLCRGRSCLPPTNDINSIRRNDKNEHEKSE